MSTLSQSEGGLSTKGPGVIPDKESQTQWSSGQRAAWPVAHELQCAACRFVAPSTSELGTHASQCTFVRCKEIMDEVLGPYPQSTVEYKDSGDRAIKWKPNPYKDNKGRYLWTDAFAVCSYLNLFHASGRPQFLKQAELLIEEVHNVLGRTRDGRQRLGPSTDLDPLLGGLRIGKEDEEGTEDGDGQYFHYLTKWAFALDRYSLASQQRRYNELAVQLLKAIHPRFIHSRSSSEPGIFWKMSIDLSRPWVRSQGNLDPFDGYVTYKLISQTAGQDLLASELQDLQTMVQARYLRYRSSDPLDLGEALWIAHWFPNEDWAVRMSAVSLQCLDHLFEAGHFKGSVMYRLAFREFGTTLGLQVDDKAAHQEKWQSRVKRLHEFWQDRLYNRDKDITPMMFVASLEPGVWKRH